jgi:hypothetical protein
MFSLKQVCNNMNERITLLALKSSDPKTGWLDRQKFAELLIRECMHECLRMQLGNQYTPEEMLFQTKYRKIIKKHFGVEE